ENRSTADSNFSQEQGTRISAGVGEINTRVTVISMTWGKGADHLPISCQRGSAIATLFCTFLFRYCDLRSQTRLKIEPTCTAVQAPSCPGAAARSSNIQASCDAPRRNQPSID